jgi:deoxyribonuclease V
VPLIPVHANVWDLTPAQARALQERLSGHAELRDRLGAPALVAGIDVGFEDRGRVTRAAVAVLSFPDLQLVESALARRTTTFPYVPGLLSFREIPAVLEALAALARTPDLLLADGQGLAHPRRFGLACHLGRLLDTPTIGVAKSRLLGEFTPPPDQRGAWSPLLDRDEVIGAAVRTRRGVRPQCAPPSPARTATACPRRAGSPTSSLRAGERGRAAAAGSVPGFAVAQGARQMADRLLMLAALDRGEVAGELEQHALLRHQFLHPCRRAIARIDILEEVADVDAERAGDLIQATGRDPVDAGLVFVRLLVGDADQLGHLLLGQAEHDTPLADAQADVAIDVQSAAPAAGATAGHFAGELVHRWCDSTARRDGFPPSENFSSDGTTGSKLSALETVALAKNAIDRVRGHRIRRTRALFSHGI